MSISIALINPKFPHNVGGVLRAASCYGAAKVYYTGQRMADHISQLSRLPREERMRGYKDVTWGRDDAFYEHLPAGTVPVAVEFRPNSENLFTFEHPDKAVYVFGPEDGSIPGQYLAQCHRFVIVPTYHCMNLSAAVNVILYDRALKRHLTSLPSEVVSQDDRYDDDAVEEVLATGNVRSSHLS